MSFFEELKRRNVIRVGIAYSVVAWLIMQFADVVLNNIDAPGWVFQVIMLMLAIGLPLVLVFAWAFEMTPEGIKKEKNVDRSQSITSDTGKRLNHTILALMAVAIAYLLIDKFSVSQKIESESLHQEATAQVASHGGDKTEPGPGSRESIRTSDNSIAVLPFANRSRDEDDAFFSDGIHDDLLTQLAKIGDLKVISRTSVMKYKVTEKTIPEIAAELGVSTILEGGIQRAGKRIRINAQLIDVVTDEHLWAETFDREMTMENIFDIQTEITRQIVTAVRGELSDTEQQALGGAPTSNLEAYEAYLHAKAATNRSDYSRDKYMEAQPWAEKAVKLDPKFAEAWAILSEINAQAVWLGYDNTPKRRDAAREALDKAISFSPESAQVKAAQADYLYRFVNDYPAALALYREAHAIAPGDARIKLYMAITMRRIGLWQESIKSFEESVLLDPANAFTATQMIDTLTWMNEWERVESLLGEWILKFPDSRDLKGQQVKERILHHGDLGTARELFDLLQPWGGYVYLNVAQSLLNYERSFDEFLTFVDSPEFAENLQYGSDVGLSKGVTYFLMGDEEQSRKHLQLQVDYLLVQPPKGTFVDAFREVGLARSWSFLGEHDKALEASRKAMTMIPIEKDAIFGTLIENNHTLVLAKAGKRDEALRRLANTEGQVEGLMTRWELYLDPVWDFFRDDERFNELSRPLNLKEAGE